MKPFFVIQLSDPHLGATWEEPDPAERLAAAVRAVNEFPSRPDAVLVSGDLTDDGADASYRTVAELLDRLEAPVHVIAGNHDDRDGLRRHFDLPGDPGAPVQYSADLGGVRLLALDSTRPGSDAGELGPERLAWIAAALAAEPDAPTLLAMHHPPLMTGVPAWDEIALPSSQRAELEAIITGHPQVRGIVSGHLHRTVLAALAGRPVLAAPSTCVQARLDFALTDFELSSDPPGFAVHSFIDGQRVSHIQPL